MTRDERWQFYFSRGIPVLVLHPRKKTHLFRHTHLPWHSQPYYQEYHNTYWLLFLTAPFQRDYSIPQLRIQKHSVAELGIQCCILVQIQGPAHWTNLDSIFLLGKEVWVFRSERILRMESQIHASQTNIFVNKSSIKPKQARSALPLVSKEHPISRMSITIFNKEALLEAELFVLSATQTVLATGRRGLWIRARSLMQEKFGRLKLISPAENNPISLRKSPACLLSE